MEPGVVTKKNSSGFDAEILGLLEVMARQGIHHAAEGFSTMLGGNGGFSIQDPKATLVPLSEISALVGGPESEAVGIYLQASGDIGGQIMLVIPYDKALELADMLMELPPGSTKSLGQIERSALAEVGNLTASYFLNTLAAHTGLDTRPSPPAVMVDMIGAILDIIVALSGGIGEYVLMLRGGFAQQGREVAVQFWVIPDPQTLAALRQKGS